MTLTNNITHSHDNKFILKESIEEKLYQIIRSLFLFKERLKNTREHKERSSIIRKRWINS